MHALWKNRVCGRRGRLEYGFDMGVIVGHICPNCQTPEENLEAQVNEATIDYSQMKTISTIDELLEILRPQWREALRLIADGKTEEGNNLFWERIEKFRKCWNAMNRYNFNVQISDVPTAYELLVDMGEFPDFLNNE